MAKLKGPLFSLGASGALGEAIVYFPWKGLNVAREYVIPSNPNTTLQQTQRGYLRDMVTFIHAAEGMAVGPLNELDKSAFALLGSCEPTPRTWFNTLVKMGIDQMRAVGGMGVVCGGAPDPHTITIDLYLWWTASVNPTSGRVYWGVSKTSLINSANADPVAAMITCTATGLVTKTTYFLQWRADAPATCVGLESGIYRITTD